MAPLTLLIAPEIPPARAVKTPTTARVMTPRTTAYSAIVCPSSRLFRSQRYDLTIIVSPPSLRLDFEADTPPPHRQQCRLGSSPDGGLPLPRYERHRSRLPRSGDGEALRQFDETSMGSPPSRVRP